jgi:hypothetical protein
MSNQIKSQIKSISPRRRSTTTHQQKAARSLAAYAGTFRNYKRSCEWLDRHRRGEQRAFCTEEVEKWGGVMCVLWYLVLLLFQFEQRLTTIVLFFVLFANVVDAEFLKLRDTMRVQQHQFSYFLVCANSVRIDRTADSRCANRWNHFVVCARL